MNKINKRVSDVRDVPDGVPDQFLVFFQSYQLFNEHVPDVRPRALRDARESKKHFLLTPYINFFPRVIPRTSRTSRTCLFYKQISNVNPAHHPAHF